MEKKIWLGNDRDEKSVNRDENKIARLMALVTQNKAKDSRF